MLKKLLQYFRNFFAQNGDSDIKPDENSDSMLNEWEKFHKIAKELTEKETHPPVPEVSYATLNLDTGKITLPDNLSAEEKAEVEAALKEFNESLQKFAPEELYKSKEDFLKSAGEMKVATKGDIFPVWEGVTPVNKEENSLSKVKEEMNFCDENTEHWNDIDFAEALHEFEAQGYEFVGVEQLYHKINAQLELTGEEKGKLRQWYKLATQEFVYGV